MPNWQPNWHDVRWNWDAAGAAARELRQTAERLEVSLVQRLAAAELASKEWRGPHRVKFDNDLDDLVRRGRRLAEDMRDGACRIDSASRRAYEEQCHRERERERWRREEREEREERERRQRN